MSAHSIPELNTVISERLYGHLMELKPAMYDRGVSFVPVIAWLPLKIPTAGKTHAWSLYFLEAAAVNKKDLFRCGELLIVIDHEDKHKLNGKLVDFLERKLHVTDMS